MTQPTVEEILQRAILCEAKNRRIYEDLAARFPTPPDVATFWHEYAEDETFHIALLTSLRDHLPPDQRNEPAPAALQESVVTLERHLAAFRPDTIRTLDDAYGAAHNLEAHELLPAFQLVATHILPESQRETWLTLQIDEHVEKLSALGERYDSGARRQLRARD